MTINTLRTTKLWFEKARANPTPQHFRSQLGVHYEEVGESLEALSGNDLETENLITDAANAIKALAEHLKANSAKDIVAVNNPLLFLDALCDQIVTATGTGHTLSYDIVGAMNEVNRSNFSKFGEDGEPLFDANLKVIKGPLYSKADLLPFLQPQ